MKTNRVVLVMTLSLGLLSHSALLADPPDPPPPPATHGQNGDGAAGAPIDGGLGILLALGATYGGRRAWKAWKQKEGSKVKGHS